MKHAVLQEYPVSDRALSHARRRYFAKQRAELLRDLTAMDQAAQAPATGEFAEPSEPVEYPVCQEVSSTGTRQYPWEARDREIDAYMESWRLKIEAEIGPFERSWHGPFTLVVPVEQAWGRIDAI